MGATESGAPANGQDALGISVPYLPLQGETGEEIPLETGRQPRISRPWRGALGLDTHGDSDIVGVFMYRDGAHLLEPASEVRQIPAQTGSSGPRRYANCPSRSPGLSRP
ncbi:MAG: hypothetical protein ABSF83_05220 [Nitrososphaerales archaeon]